MGRLAVEAVEGGGGLDEATLPGGAAKELPTGAGEVFELLLFLRFDENVKFFNREVMGEAVRGAARYKRGERDEGKVGRGKSAALGCCDRRVCSVFGWASWAVLRAERGRGGQSKLEGRILSETRQGRTEEGRAEARTRS